MNQKGHFIQKKGMSLKRNEVPVEKGENLLALENKVNHSWIVLPKEPFLEAKTPKTDGSFGKSNERYPCAGGRSQCNAKDRIGLVNKI